MPVSNAHLNNLCQVWDGKTQTMMEKDKAEKLAEQGKVQICTGLQAKDLKRPEEFKTRRKKTGPRKRKDQSYKTREVRAENTEKA